MLWKKIFDRSLCYLYITAAKSNLLLLGVDVKTLKWNTVLDHFTVVAKCAKNKIEIKKTDVAHFFKLPWANIQNLTVYKMITDGQNPPFWILAHGNFKKCATSVFFIQILFLAHLATSVKWAIFLCLTSIPTTIVRGWDGLLVGNPDMKAICNFIFKMTYKHLREAK